LGAALVGEREGVAIDLAAAARDGEEAPRHRRRAGHGEARRRDQAGRALDRAALVRHARAAGGLPDQVDAADLVFDPAAELAAVERVLRLEAVLDADAGRRRER